MRKQKIKKETNLLKTLKFTVVIITSIFVIFTAVKAGNITPPGGTPEAQFYTLSEIYTRITTNAASTEGGHDFTFSDGLAGTGRTLTEIYNAIPTITADTVKLGTAYLGVDGTLIPSGGDATTANVLDGKTFFGDSQTDWNLQTGTMANVGAQTIIPSTSNQMITQGYHDGAGCCEGDADLIAGNIKSGINLFGINGDGNVVDTSTGDAIAGDTLSGKIAWVDGTEITGTMPTQTLSNANETLSAGYYATTILSAVDTDLATGNIKSGITIFGIDGDGNVVDTSTGDAVAGDTLSGKIAWVDGSEITGTISNCSSEGGNTCYAANGYWVSLLGDNVSGADGSKTFSISDGYYSSKTATCNDTDLIAGNVKSSVDILGVAGTYSGYPGTGWTGSGLTETACGTAGGWEWFEDANGDGDTTDPEDGICVRTATVDSDSWNGAEQMVGNGCYPTACDSDNECPEDSVDKCATATNASTGSTLHDDSASGWTNNKG